MHKANINTTVINGDWEILFTIRNKLWKVKKKKRCWFKDYWKNPNSELKIFLEMHQNDSPSLSLVTKWHEGSQGDSKKRKQKTSNMRIIKTEKRHYETLICVKGYSGWATLYPLKKTLPFFKLWESSKSFSKTRSKGIWGIFSWDSVPRTSFWSSKFTNRQTDSFPLSFLASPRQACQEKNKEEQLNMKKCQTKFTGNPVQNLRKMEDEAITTFNPKGLTTFDLNTWA